MSIKICVGKLIQLKSKRLQEGNMKNKRIKSASFQNTVLSFLRIPRLVRASELERVDFQNCHQADCKWSTSISQASSQNRKGWFQVFSALQCIEGLYAFRQWRIYLSFIARTYLCRDILRCPLVEIRQFLLFCNLDEHRELLSLPFTIYH